MKFTNLVLASALVIGSVGVAVAQAPAGGGAGGGRGGAMRAACGADITANCAGKTGQEIRQCLNDNQSKLSADCKTALAAGRGGAGGGAAAPAGQ